MKGDLLLRALEIIGEIACDTREFLSVFLSSSKSNYSGLKSYYNRLAPKKGGWLDKKVLDRNKYYVLLSRLKSAGFITKGAKDGSAWAITKAGLIKLKLLRQKEKNNFPENKYQKEKSDHLIIFGFDIPEKEKRKRNWIRRILIGLGFTMLQKSVWMGKVRIPGKFIEDIRRLGLIEFVEIFSVGNSGTIRHIV